ncbi:DUF3040 domain-containing protein [Spelaeicoccus albus]|uniref:Flp pilus assembly protein TadB n=1 Tax=Spelaeicoccus albus TaxID=1280376 RepID=A0A7Z0D4F8_9MICO|nr:DUF3040 domain-containing protein [Spelaeicoccus albus]NYI68665.1 Flp pilus assembly protein TadB [Spelaeicoccus albus]
MLSKDERQRLHEIERQFAGEDPQLAHEFAKAPIPGRFRRILAWIFFALSMFVMTLAAGLYGAITVLVVTFAVIALAPAWRRHVAREQQLSRTDYDNRSFH